MQSRQNYTKQKYFEIGYVEIKRPLIEIKSI